MDAFFRENKTEIDRISGAYTLETLLSYSDYLIAQKEPFSLVLLDIDNFSYISDAFGVDCENKVIGNVSHVVKSVIGDNGVLIRGDRDEFAIIFKNITNYDELWNLCHTILVKINEIVLPEIENQTLTVTIGLARFPENAPSYDYLLTCARKALYRGKTKGRNCFIIYLPEKHANITPKNETQRALGSLNLHSNVYKFLIGSDDLKSGIMSLFNFISSYFEVDHICIQANEQLLFQKIHQMSKTKDFSFVPHELIKNSINQLTGVLYLNDTKNLLKAKHEQFYNALVSQSITSTCFAEISYRDVFYGTIRVDMTGNGEADRLLQYSDMDLLLTAAKTIAMILHYTGKTLETL